MMNNVYNRLIFSENTFERLFACRVSDEYAFTNSDLSCEL